MSSHHGHNCLPGYGVKLADKAKYDDRTVVDDRAKYSPRLHPDDRARMKREEQRMRCEVEERARYEDKLKAQADERHQRYQNWRELDAKAAEERRLEDQKRLAAKEEEWFHREERLKNEERARYQRTNKYDGQQLMGPAGPDRSVTRSVVLVTFKSNILLLLVTINSNILLLVTLQIAKFYAIYAVCRSTGIVVVVERTD